MCTVLAGHVFPIILLGSESAPTAAACLSPTSYLQISHDDSPGPAPTPGLRLARRSAHSPCLLPPVLIHAGPSFHLGQCPPCRAPPLTG